MYLWWELVLELDPKYGVSQVDRRFRCTITSSKIRIFQNPFTDQEITPCPTFHPNFSYRSPVRGEKFLLKPCPFLVPGHIMRCFGLFVPGSL